MAGLQQGRAASKRVFKKPKTYQKAAQMYKEVFDGPTHENINDQEFSKKYSRVTHKELPKVRKTN